MPIRSINKIHKALIVVLDNIGDAVIGSSLVPVLQKLNPKIEVGLWVKKYAAQTFHESLPQLRIHAADPFWDKSPGVGKGTFSDFKKSLDEIKAVRYDAAIILNTEWRRSLACWWVKIPIRIGYRQRKSQYFLTDSFERRQILQHVSEDHVQLVQRAFNVTEGADLAQPAVSLTANETEEGKKWMRTFGWDAKYILAIHPITGDPRKDWPINNWVEAAQKLTQENSDLRINVLSSPSQKNFLEKAFQSVNSSVLKVSSGNLSNLKSRLGVSHVFTGGDSGPGHIAGALHVPSLSLFGMTKPERYKPMGSGVKKIIKRGKVSDITVSEVVRSIQDMLT